MSSEVAKVEQLAPAIIEQVLLKGDLSKLDNNQRLSYYKQLCHSLNLNPLTKPFEYMNLSGKTVLYATKACTEQLRMRDGISIEEVTTTRDDDFVRVVAKAKNKEGRTDVALAVVCITGLKGEARANAEMKCDTKAKRRVTLSIAGLGMIDETEVETIPDVKKISAEDVYDGSSEPELYTIPFGKFKDRRPEDLDESELKGYVKWIFDSAAKKGKVIEGQVLEFLEYSQNYLAEKVMNDEFKHITK